MPIEDRKVGRVRAKSFDRRRSPMVGLAGFVFVVGGLALAGLGVATMYQPSLHPYVVEAAWILERLRRGGEQVMLVGVALAVTGVVLFSMRSFSRLLGADRESAEAIEDLARATTNQAECIEGLQSLVAVLRQESAEVMVVLRDQAAQMKRREENDPAFRIAASLDQVGARLDRAILDTRHQLLDELQQSGSRGQAQDDGALLDGLDRVEGSLRELATLTIGFQQALDSALQPMGSDAPADDAEPEPAPVSASWSDLQPRASLERYGHSDDGEPTDRDAQEWDAHASAPVPDEEAEVVEAQLASNAGELAPDEPREDGLAQARRRADRDASQRFLR
jgi:hypothetical protein